MKLKKKNVIEKTINLLLNILIFMFSIFLLISVYIGFQIRIIGHDYANFFGYSLFEVQTGSMGETIKAGDWIIVKLTPKVKVNDIIAYELDGEYITHRVVEIYKGTYITKGDANNSKDEPVSQQQIVGKVVKTLGGLGIIRKTLFNPAVLLALIITLFIFNTAFKHSNISFKEMKEKYLLGFEAFKNKIKEIIKGKKEINSYKDYKKVNSDNLELELEEDNLSKVKKYEKLEEDLGKTALYRIVSVEDEEVSENFKNKTAPRKTEEELEEELGKTSLYRIVSVDAKGLDEKYKTVELKTEDVIQSKTSPKMEKYAELEDELGKTSVFRVISVDAEEVNKNDSLEEDDSPHQFVSVNQDEVDKTLLEIAETEMKNPKPPALKEDKKKVVEKEFEEEDDESLTTINLEMLKSKMGRKGKNIIDKILIIKKEEINELIELLTKNDPSYIYRATIKNKLTTIYTDAKYYNYYGSVQIETRGRNITSRVKALLQIRSDNLKKEYKNKNPKYDNIIEQYKQLFILIADLEQARDAITEVKVKREFYKKLLLKHFKDEEGYKIERLVKEVIKVQKSYLDTITFFLQKLETNMFSLKLNKITGIKDMFGLKLEHNINFSKIYSDYIIDKTYTEGIVAEDKIAVMFALLSKQLINDIMTGNYDRKYVFYLSSSLYTKERKLGSLLREIDNEYAKSNLIILVTYDILLNHRQLLKEYRKKGYKFGLTFNKDDKILKSQLPYLYIVNCLFINKRDEMMKPLLSVIPKDLSNKIISEEMTLKVGDVGGE